MKKSCSKLVLVFLMIVMTLCFVASAQADIPSNSGTQGGTISITTLPPLTPAPVKVDVDWLLLLVDLFIW